MCSPSRLNRSGSIVPSCLCQHVGLYVCMCMCVCLSVGSYLSDCTLTDDPCQPGRGRWRRVGKDGGGGGKHNRHRLDLVADERGGGHNRSRPDLAAEERRDPQINPPGLSVTAAKSRDCLRCRLEIRGT